MCSHRPYRGSGRRTVPPPPPVTKCFICTSTSSCARRRCHARTHTDTDARADLIQPLRLWRWDTFELLPSAAAERGCTSPKWNKGREMTRVTWRERALVERSMVWDQLEAAPLPNTKQTAFKWLSLVMPKILLLPTSLWLPQTTS